MRGIAGGACLLLVLAARLPAQSPANPAPLSTAAAVCASCHAREAAAFARTAMARSFAIPAASNKIENFQGAVYYHQPSNTWYEMVARAGSLYQRQYQIGFDGKQTSVVEKRVDYILGSGQHARTYLNRTPANTLIELPLAWYAEKGGSWAMNPGYDAPDHEGLHRRIDAGCMFCHNAYPSIEPGTGQHGVEPVYAATLPQGIDCERCHGPGAAHVKLARTPGAQPQQIRSAIVNPARLAPERQMEVCMQCHLETTSFPLPNSMVRYERGPFSYRAGEPLSDFKLFFDRADATGNGDVEIASAAYRLRQSECFRQSSLETSKARLSCTTCHDPHGASTPATYTAACRSCHTAAFDRLVTAGKHTASSDCTGCHMPKSRTSDVIHVAMTDHDIRREKPAGDLLAPRSETHHNGADAYRGTVELYYPAALPRPEDELYLATAQVSEGSNREAGIPRLAAAIARFQPAQPDHYLQLADAYRNASQCAQALPFYEEALRRDPQYLAAMRKESLCYDAMGDSAHSIAVLRRALQLSSKDATLWTQLGVVYASQGNTPEAAAALGKALELDPELTEAWNGLGGIWLNSDPAKAEPALRNALRFQPNYAEAHNNLASLLANTGRFEEARYHYEEALRDKPGYAFARFNYGVALTREGRLAEARAQLETLVREQPAMADAHEALGIVLAGEGRAADAISQYRAALAIRPDLARANLSLGAALAEGGDIAAALPYLRRAAASTESAIQRQAEALLRQYNSR